VLFLNEGGKNATIDTRYGDFKVEIEKIRKNAIENPQRFPPEDMSRDIRTIVVNRLQSAIDEAGLALHTFMDPNGLLTVRHNDFGDKAIFSVTSSIAGIGAEEVNVAAFSRAGKNVEGTIAGQIAMGDGQFLTAIDGTKASGVTVAYEREIGLKEVPVLDQRGVQVGTEFIEETNEEVVGSGPEGYVHVAQFSNEFQLGPNSGQSERLSLKNVKANMLGQGIENSSGFQSLTDIDVTNSQGAQDSNKVVDAAIDQISTLRADLGAFQKNALESNLNSLRIAEENLTSAESTIRDADVAQQMSQLTGDQIMLSANTAMIAQANQVPRTVLGLIENSSF
jgi:flagellin